MRPPLMDDRTWMTVAQIRAVLHYDTDDATRKWLRRRGVVSVRRGKANLYARVDFERAVSDWWRWKLEAA